MAEELFPGQAKSLESLERDMNESYKNALNAVRKYYDSCKVAGAITPEKGLQAMVYEVGKRVSTGGKKNARKNNRRFMIGFEYMRRFCMQLIERNN